MIRWDCNAFVGRWPFHKVRGPEFIHLEAKHQRYGISGGFVSSLEAIFYNDPYEADVDLAEALAGRRDYRQVITANPKLPGCCRQVLRALGEINVAGVRIAPGFHDYAMHAPELEALCGILAERQLPLFLTLHMEDARMEYMFQSQEIYAWDLAGFLQRHKDFPILLCNIRSRELRWIRRVLENQENISADVSGLKDGVFNMEGLYADGFTKYLVYGSVSPLFCMKSSLLLADAAEMPQAEKQRIFSGAALLDQLDEQNRPHADPPL